MGFVSQLITEGHHIAGTAFETSHAEIYRPKVVSPSFVKLVRCAHPSFSNEPFLSHQPSLSGQSRRPRGIPAAKSGRGGRDPCDLRPNACRKDMRGVVESGEGMDQVVLQDVSGQHQGRAPQAADLCRERGGANRTGTRSASLGNSDSPTRDCSASQQDHAKGQGRSSASSGVTNWGGHDCQRGDLGTVGCDNANEWSRSGVPAGDHGSLAGSSSQHRERLDGDSHVDPPSELSSPVDQICMAGDFDGIFVIALSKPTSSTNVKETSINLFTK